MLDTDLDLESDALDQASLLDDEAPAPAAPLDDAAQMTPRWFAARAAAIYQTYAGPLRGRFRWLGPALFMPALRRDLQRDAERLLAILAAATPWQPAKDSKLQLLIQLLHDRPTEKVLIFTQFADTVAYLAAELARAGVRDVGAVTGQSENPTALARRFSPRSNGVTDSAVLAQQLRVLVATDVLSEGQNLQDCHVIVNYDLPWAIIRLIQRAGRVDRIGQAAPEITCYTYLPADGIEQIIRLRARVRDRLRQNQEVVGTDEQFFEDDGDAQLLHSLYTETTGVLDDDRDDEVDLASYAYQIWDSATKKNPQLRKQVANLPNVVYTARRRDDPTAPLLSGDQPAPSGALVYLRTPQGTDALAWVNAAGQSVTQSQFTILKAAACEPTTAAVPRAAEHHQLVTDAFQLVKQQELLAGGLGSARGARFRVYETLTQHRAELLRNAPLLVTDSLEQLIDDLHRYPLQQRATDTFNRQLRSGITPAQLVEVATSLRERGELSVVHIIEETDQEPQVVCSLGLL